MQPARVAFLPPILAALVLAAAVPVHAGPVHAGPVLADSAGQRPSVLKLVLSEAGDEALVANAGRVKEFMALAEPDPSLPAERSEDFLLPETLALREHVEALHLAGVRPNDDVGGTAVLGVRVGGHGYARRPNADPEVTSRLAGWDGYGALVIGVVPGAPADLAGLIPGDVIVRFAGLWVDSEVVLVRLASRAQPGQEYEIEFLRDGEVERAWVMPVGRGELVLEEPARAP